jgi:hypothetical protein
MLDTTSQKFGLLTSRSASALQSRATFLLRNPLYILYFWELADRHQLLQLSRQQLDDDVAASDASSAPSATSTHTAAGCTRQQTQQDEPPQESSQDIFALSDSIRFLAKAEDVRQVRLRIANLHDQARNYGTMFAESDDNPTSARARFYKNKVQRITDEIATLDIH